jgi:hypothetical protein
MSELTVASTTDSQKDIEAAAGAAPPEEADTQVVETTEETPAEQAETPEPEEKPAKPAKSGFQKRIDTLVREKYEADRRADALEERLKALERGEKPAAPAAQPEPVAQQERAVKPKPDDVDKEGKPKFANYEEFSEALADWKFDERMAREVEQAQVQDREARQREQFDTYNSRVAEFKLDHPDFDKLLGTRAIPKAAVNAVIRLGQPEVAYFLGQHPEICQELMDNVDDDIFVVARIGQIATQIGAPVEKDEEEEGIIPAGPDTPARIAKTGRIARVSSAPAPITPVKGSATKSSVPIDELPYSDYRRIREQQLKNRYRR